MTKKFGRFAVIAAILAGALVFAGCVQPSADLGGGG
jgi:PBP1b-binding outer membrane lipoprotein LpoB